MKPIIAFLSGLLTFIISFTTVAQQKAGQNDKSLLWQINGNQLAKPSFLFGTIHLICSDDFLWTDKMNESFEKSEKICFEMDLDDPNVMMHAALGLIDNSGKKLKDYFTPAQYKIIESYVKDSLGLQIEMFEQMKPVALLSMVGTSGVNCANQVSYEDSLMKNAEKDKKEIMGLEAPQEQLDVLESIPADTVVKQLLDAIQNNNANDSEFQQLITAYKKQDLPALYSLLTATKDLTEDLGIFLDERNKKWIPRMTDKMKSNSVFFAVGAGHLYGKEGVINLLRNEGYTVEPLK